MIFSCKETLCYKDFDVDKKKTHFFVAKFIYFVDLSFKSLMHICHLTAELINLNFRAIFLVQILNKTDSKIISYQFIAILT